MPEELVLMRALRDMNLPKFVFEDVPLFKGLISDLFPNMEVERKPFDRKDKILQYQEKE
jgi:dynein heavy chain